LSSVATTMHSWPYMFKHPAAHTTQVGKDYRRLVSPLTVPTHNTPTRVPPTKLSERYWTPLGPKLPTRLANKPTDHRASSDH
ncbi:hypothetical protein FRC11_009939, partial [Ceratobasidium sp. 423]